MLGEILTSSHFLGNSDHSWGPLSLKVGLYTLSNPPYAKILMPVLEIPPLSRQLHCSCCSSCDTGVEWKNLRYVRDLKISYTSCGGGGGNG